jgi:exodeoxyribonuclease III
MKKSFYSFNVNGIRSALNKGFGDWLNTVKPDIVCIQETKAQPEQIDTILFEALGYYSYVFSAEKRGYSGVAVLSKLKPDNVIYGMGIDRYDSEGRLLRLDFNDISLINSYFPSGTTGDLRQDFKMDYLKDFKTYIDALKISRPNLIIAGDFNICHKEIDISKPENKKGVSGFLPEERNWVSEFLGSGFVDSFRVYNSEPNQYSWWSYRAGARQKNLGWRIDYHMVSETLMQRFISADIHQDIVMSDHCPVSLELEY